MRLYLALAAFQQPCRIKWAEQTNPNHPAVTSRERSGLAPVRA